MEMKCSVLIEAGDVVAGDVVIDLREPAPGAVRPPELPATVQAVESGGTGPRLWFAGEAGDDYRLIGWWLLGEHEIEVIRNVTPFTWWPEQPCDVCGHDDDTHGPFCPNEPAPTPIAAWSLGFSDEPYPPTFPPPTDRYPAFVRGEAPPPAIEHELGHCLGSVDVESPPEAPVRAGIAYLSWFAGGTSLGLRCYLCDHIVTEWGISDETGPTLPARSVLTHEAEQAGMFHYGGASTDHPEPIAWRMSAPPLNWSMPYADEEDDDEPEPEPWDEGGIPGEAFPDNFVTRGESCDYGRG